MTRSAVRGSSARSASRSPLLEDRSLLQYVHRLAKRDNYTNFLYLVRAYAVLALVLGGTIWFCENHLAQGGSWWGMVPVIILAMFGIGIIQHQLGGLAHEAIHHMLFKNRILNELVSDIFCMAPILSLTYFFRLEHLGHHHFVNDNKRDPDYALLSKTDFWYDKPMTRKQLVYQALRVLSPFAMIRYMVYRLQFAGMIHKENPYWRIGKHSPALINWGFYAYFILTFVLDALLMMRGNAWLLGLSQLTLTGGMVAIYLLSPKEIFTLNRLKPVIPLRTALLIRFACTCIAINGMAWLGYYLGSVRPLLYLFLCYFAGFTAFGIVTILQQAVQHANADRGILTNSTVIDLNPLVNFCLFPVSLGYHQAHHLFPAVPHFRVRKLHRKLMEYPEYRNKITIVRGYLFPRMGKKHYPTVVEFLLKPRHTQPADTAFIDPRVVQDDALENLPSDGFATI